MLNLLQLLQIFRTLTLIGYWLTGKESMNRRIEKPLNPGLKKTILSITELDIR